MLTLARWFTYASLFVFLLALVAGCGGDDGAKSQAMMTGETAGTAACITLKDMPCACGPAGVYGVYGCDGKCLQCPAPASAAGTGASPTAPRGAAGGGP